MDAVLDTTVILHLFRKYPPSLNWLNTRNIYGVTFITWMEVMQGASNKANQSQCKSLLSQFELLYHTSFDQDWAGQQLEQFHFSHHISFTDCMIASVAYRLQLPLYTHNLKDMTPMLGKLAIKPYA